MVREGEERVTCRGTVQSYSKDKGLEYLAGDNGEIFSFRRHAVEMPG
jgi:hypothetical protein